MNLKSDMFSQLHKQLHCKQCKVWHIICVRMLASASKKTHLTFEQERGKTNHYFNIRTIFSWRENSLAVNLGSTISGMQVAFVTTAIKLVTIFCGP